MAGFPTARTRTNLNPQSRTRRAQLILILAAVIAAITAVFVWEASKKGFAWAKFRDVISDLEISWLLLASAIAIATYVGRALRWRVLLRPVSRDPRMWGLISATMIGFAAVTILGRPGEFVRPYLIAKREGVPFSSQLAAWVVERIYDLLVALLIFGFALSQIHAENDKMNPGPALTWIIQLGGWVVLALSLICLTMLVAIRRFANGSRQTLTKRFKFLSGRRLGPLERWFDTFLQGAACTKSTGATLQIIFWSVFEWVLIAACYACIVRSFGTVVRFDWLDVIILMGFVSFGCLIQIPGVGGGVQVVGVLVLTEIFGLPLETATSMAVIIWLITFVLIVPFGVGLALREGITWATVKAAGREAIS